jgi:phage baseplate assembly protein W
MNMATNFLVPFSLTPQGGIATTSDPGLIALQRVESLVGTPDNERVMLPSYGVNLPGYLFAPDLSADTQQIANDISNALHIWEPAINVISVTPVVNEQQVGLDNVIVDFSQSANSAFTPTQTATVLVGGTVVTN